MFQQVTNWFRDKHNIEIYCPNYYKNTKGYKPEYECRVNGKQLSPPVRTTGIGGDNMSCYLYPTYNEALLKCYEYALELIK